MKKDHPISLAWLIGLPLVLLAGCNKKLEKLPDCSSLCSIRWIAAPTFYPVGDQTDTLRFSYDRYGNPTTIIRPGTGTEVNDYIFWYDHQHRLTDVIGTYFVLAPTGSGFDTRDKLFYTNGRVSKSNSPLY